VHLVFPLSTGEQGVLEAQGTPAVLVQAGGERGPPARAAVSSERLEGLGRSVLSAVDALDGAPNISTATQGGIVLAHQELPGWALSLLALMLILPVLAVGVDGLARLRRRGVGVAHWAAWTITGRSAAPRPSSPARSSPTCSACSACSAAPPARPRPRARCTSACSRRSRWC
jgi:hypothetical protein